MAQTSLPQGGSGVGDAGPYSSDEWAEYMQIVYTGDQQATQGVLIRYLNELAVTNPAGVTISIDTGAGFVDGHLLVNDAAETITVNLCGVGGQTRQNRVIMVENNTNVLYSPGNLLFPAAYAAGIPRNSARLAILQGSCGTPGGLPALVQNANYWYTELYRFGVGSAVVGALTDYRDYCEFSTEVVTGMIADDAVTATQIAPGAVGTPEIAAGAVTTVEILNNTIVAGDVANETLTPTQILNRTRKFFVSFVSGRNITDGTDITLGIEPGNVYGCIELPDNKQASAGCWFSVPEDFTSGLSVTGVVYKGTGGNLNAVVAYSIQYGACGESMNQHMESSGNFTEVIVGNNKNCITSDTLPSANASDIAWVRLVRTGTSISDTINGPLYALGLVVEYTADS